MTWILIIVFLVGSDPYSTDQLVTETECREILADAEAGRPPHVEDGITSFPVLSLKCVSPDGSQVIGVVMQEPAV